MKKTEAALLKYSSIMEHDERLNAWHFALMNAILILGIRQGQDKIINVSRSRIMKLSCIATLPTYHKYFRELQDMAYIAYVPSYHPNYRSIVKLLY